MKLEDEHIEAVRDYFIQLGYFNHIKVLVAFLSGNAALGLSWLDETLAIEYVSPLVNGKETDILEVNGLSIKIKGHNVKEFCEHIASSSIAYMEIAHSPVVYVGDIDFCKRITRLASDAFLENSAMKSYWVEHGSKKKPITRIRKRLSYKWVVEHHCMPPMNFKQLVNATVEDEMMRKFIDKISEEDKVTEEYSIIVHYLGMIKHIPTTKYQGSRTSLECELSLLALDMNKKYSIESKKDDEETK